MTDKVREILRRQEEKRADIYEDDANRTPTVGSLMDDLHALRALVLALLEERDMAMNGTWDEFYKIEAVTNAALAKFVKEWEK